MDLCSVGSDGYALSQAQSDRLNQLIIKLTIPLALPPTLPNESVNNAVLEEMVESICCDVLQEEERDAMSTLELA